MSILLDKISQNDNLDIQRYNYYREITIHNLNKIKLRFTDNCMSCIDIDINNKGEFMNIMNINLIGKKINSIESIENIFNNVMKLFNEINHTHFIFDRKEDPLFLFDKRKIITKNNINRSLVLEKFKISNRHIHKHIPKELQLNHKQVFEMIFSEVDKVNKNQNYLHYIDFKDNDPYTLLFRFKYDKCELSEKLKKLKSKFNIDYIEIIVNLDNTLYPIIPPTIEYSKPNMNNNMIYNLKKINIFDQKNWNINISIEWLITEIGNKFEPYVSKYIDIDNIELKISEMDEIIFKIFTIMGINEYSDFNINFKIPKFDTKDKSKYWGSGTGYGYEGKTDWDINNYLFEQNNKKADVIKHLQTIINRYPEYDDKETINKIMTRFITNQLRGTTILDFSNNKELYIMYLRVIEEIEILIDFNIIAELYNEINEIYHTQELYDSLDNHTKDFCIKINKLFEFQEKQIESTITNLDNEKINYEKMIKENQFGTYVFDQNHLHYKWANCKITNKKNLLRLISEISTLKKNLPINWDTSCLLRVDKKQTNMIKFIITGPKDTPYHNGIYEFHAYFPPTYPDKPPQVLLNTTDGGKVRFNPNLYACGKVCLSLLGTWSGQQGETWNGGISTFLQVIISIQSLILVEDPFFNEPGYEKSMHTPAGKTRAFEYKDNIRNNNLRVAILNQLKNPPEGFEEFTINHFKAKKDEILQIADIWKNETATINKIKIDAFIKHFKELINSV